MEVGEVLLGKFPMGAQLRISELGKASRCGYCGCVYVNGTKIGTWNSGVLGQGWHSGHYSAKP